MDRAITLDRSGELTAAVPARPPVTLYRWARIPVALLAGAAIAGYLAVVLLRIRYPFELEWMEGGSVDHVRRVLDGQPLYVQPSLEFVPYIYTPLYFYVAALAAKLFGLGFLALRVVSFAASLGSAAIIFLLVQRETRSAFFGLVSCGLFLACFRATGAWYDLARVDSLFLLLCLLAAYRCRFAASWRSAALAGVLAGLAFLTKQSGLVVGLSLAVYLLRRHRRWGGLFVAVLAAIVVGTTVVANAASSGWYGFYVFELPRRHPILRDQILGFWRTDMLRVAPAVALALLAVPIWLRRRGEGDALLWFYVPVATAMIGASWMSRMHSGGYDNVLIPAFAVMSILFGLGGHAFLQGVPRRTASSPAHDPGALPAGFFLAVALGQFSLLAYDPRAQVPSRADLAAGRQMMSQLRALDGEVWMPGHGAFTGQAGRGTFAQGFAMLDVLRAEGARGKAPLLASISDAIADQRFSAVIVDSDPEVSVLPPDFQAYYRASGPLVSSVDALYPVTGARLRPETVYLPSGRGPQPLPR